eukprot:TRINITY_DN56053_c0_g1_i1.p1 TRINITY_DN56053_c0_g1~~TRINITY_DN56053_c0_g1_i1.p1  ORF type:complete len:478 (-),score=118.56 TRINITY_DN56053_c0_g1_i1:80-1513(-)
MSAPMQPSHQVEEDINQNPFLQVLRDSSSFSQLYQAAAERGDATIVLVPCTECLDNEGFGQIFVETHILQASHVPNCYTNLLGQGIEIKDSRSVTTDLGFQDQRSCQILQSESIYDYSSRFRVLVIDKPLIGRFKTLPGAGGSDTQLGSAGSGGASEAKGAVRSSADAMAWLSEVPSIEDLFYEKLLQFRRTFVQVPGCEQSTSERIREIVGETVQKVIKHHNLQHTTQHRQLDYQVSRNAYALLHAFVFPHLQHILSEAEQRLEKAIRSFETTEELLHAIPGASARLGRVDVRPCATALATMDHQITPHEKITYINQAYSALQEAIQQANASSGVSKQQEITGDDVLSLFILAIRSCALKDRLAQIAYVEMYLQGAASSSGSNEAARFEEAGYAVSALQAALQFFLEDAHRPASNTGAGGSSGAASASRGGAGAAGGGSARGLGAAAFGDMSSGDFGDTGSSRAYRSSQPAGGGFR